MNGHKYKPNSIRDNKIFNRQLLVSMFFTIVVSLLLSLYIGYGYGDYTVTIDLLKILSVIFVIYFSFIILLKKAGE